MKSWKIYAASGFFVLLTAIKLLFPNWTAQVQSEVRKIVERNDDYRAIIETMGQWIGDGSWRDELVEVFERRTQAGDTVKPWMYPELNRGWQAWLTQHRS